MRNFSLLITLLITSNYLISCGEAVLEPSNLEARLGQAIQVDEEDKLSTAEVENLGVICDALAEKEFNYRGAIRSNSPVELEFLMQQKSCNEDSLPEAEQVVASLIDEAGVLKYQSSSTTSEVLVPESKILEGLCQGTASADTPRYVLYGSCGVWFQFLSNNEGACASGQLANPGQSRCLVLNFAKKNAADQFVIHSVELYEVQTTAANTGLVLRQNLTSNMSCQSQGQFSIKNQSLKL